MCISKPAGLLSQPDVSRAPSACAVAARGGRTWPVHRLDRRVTGCLLLARSRQAAASCSAAFAAATVTKHYLGVAGRGERAARVEVGECGRLIEGATGDRVVEWRALAVAEGSALLAISPLGGSKHQIRKALASAGLALAGDVRYGGRAVAGGALTLHAATLQLDHPLHGWATRLRIFSPLPPEWELGLPAALVTAATEVLRPHGGMRHNLDDSVLWDPPPEPEPYY
eukprot:CAMPEP_0181174566 /NCGR_PEP_ID=MMETSP1096-20121128/3612_1 /TAXON_ID=156174 ORGANISM="Chrysochromulina ericina, Strain CCMP281" /NCGR_SAMPLE_ID=MMETSP1096 /ASSEMBLY_ACC=CAM_ASM_000453 /LENGTH=226 /DNA_ID=CAMNT_0023262491 /DNA_START=1 /DNA_END=681 /DNA_ORIENTATION=+